MFKKILDQDMPAEMYNHIFSFLSNRDICNINLTCKAAWSADDYFWIRKSRIEFNAETSADANPQEFYVDLFKEKKGIKEKSFLSYLLEKYMLTIEDAKRYEELMDDQNNIIFLTKETLDKYSNNPESDKSIFTQCFEKMFNQLLFCQDFIQEKFFIAAKLLFLSLQEEASLLNELKDLFSNPFSEESEHRIRALYEEHTLLRFYIDLAIPLKRDGDSFLRVYRGFKHHDALFTKEEIAKIFMSRDDANMASHIILNAVSLNSANIFTLILKKQPKLIHCECTDDIFSLLHQACMAKSYEIAKLLLEHGANVNLNCSIKMAREIESRNFLYMPIRSASALFGAFVPKKTCQLSDIKKLVDLLLQYRADPDLKFVMDDFPANSLREFCKDMLNEPRPVLQDPLRAKQAEEFAELLKCILDFKLDAVTDVSLENDKQDRVNKNNLQLNG